MMTRRHVAWVVWSFARWAWTNRKTAIVYELVVIREGQESDDYLRMLFRAQRQWLGRVMPSVKFGGPISFEAQVDGATPQPQIDIGAEWRDLQRRNPGETS